MATDTRLLAPLLVILAHGLWAVLDVNTKILTATIPAEQLVWLRYATLAVLILAVRAVVPGFGGPVRTRVPHLHLLRAAAMVACGFAMYFALRNLTLAEAYLVFFTAPLVTLGLAAAFLREPAPPAALLWASLGFLGIVVALAPGITAEGTLLGYAAGAAGSVGYAVVLTVSRRLKAERGLAMLLLWSAVPASVVLAPLALSVWVPPAPWEWALLIVNGVLAGAATYALTVAFGLAPASRLAALEYTALLYAFGFDLVIWHLLPGPWVVAGMALVVLACVMAERAAHRGR
ncbi:MAG: DMT family transporter [Acetobacteraceae bacterium]|nr:DMT family transporter [Acetobacteraceae bacterium]MCX7685136.1 DMT family transporter [Acetobacteraceae bacterium]MDW8398858.1 DMT family transporter [Acetobacteraceae bacterium]